MKLTIVLSHIVTRVACLAVALAWISGTAQDAQAAEYRVWACANGSGAPLGVGSWARKIDSSLTDVQATCGESSTGVGAFVVRARGSAAPRPGGGSWVLAAPRGTRITGLDVWWSWQILPSAPRGAIRAYALGSAFLAPAGVPDPFDGRGPCCSDTVFAIAKPGSFGFPTLSDPAIAFGKLNRQSFARLRGLDGRGTSLVALSAQCITGCNSSEVVAQYQAYRMKTVVEDPAKPTGAAEGLRDGLRVGPGTTVGVKATDAGGGVREVTLRVDGQVVQRLSGGDGCADVDAANADPLEYSLMAPCPPTRSGSLTLAAENLPENEPHSVTAVATDAAGQDAVLGSARVALAAPPHFYEPKHGFYNPDLNVADARHTNGANAADGARLSLRFVGRRGSTTKRTVDYSSPARIRGRLSVGNKPVARARVWLASRLASGEWRISRKPLRTSPRGIVSARLSARGPSRDLRLVYFPYTDTNTSSRSASRALRVRSTTTIQSDQGGYRNGDTLTFTGRVIRKRLIDNKSVYLQARVRGKWRTFATTQADSEGRWRMSHRFEATRRPTIYRFRAVVPSQTGYDWATGHSRTVRVLVTP